MQLENKMIISVQTTINASLEKVWKCWTTPADIVKWNTASDDWHTTNAVNDLQVGGKFNYRMETKDGSFGFDFWGIYDEIEINKLIISTLGDNRSLKITFSHFAGKTEVVESFEAENENPVDVQRGGWQTILDNFKKHVENN